MPKVIARFLLLRFIHRTYELIDNFHFLSHNNEFCRVALIFFRFRESRFQRFQYLFQICLFRFVVLGKQFKSFFRHFFRSTDLFLIEFYYDPLDFNKSTFCFSRCRRYPTIQFLKTHYIRKLVIVEKFNLFAKIVNELLFGVNTERYSYPISSKRCKNSRFKSSPLVAFGATIRELIFSRHGGLGRLCYKIKIVHFTFSSFAHVASAAFKSSISSNQIHSTPIFIKCLCMMNWSFLLACL